MNTLPFEALRARVRHRVCCWTDALVQNPRTTLRRTHHGRPKKLYIMYVDAHWTRTVLKT